MLLRAAFTASLLLSLGLPVKAETMPSAPFAAIPAGKISHKVQLDALPDRQLIGQKVDIYERRMSNNSAQRDLLNLVVGDVVLLASPEVDEWGASTRQATFALDSKQIQRLKKYESRVGSSLIVVSR